MPQTGEPKQTPAQRNSEASPDAGLFWGLAPENRRVGETKLVWVVENETFEQARNAAAKRRHFHLSEGLGRAWRDGFRPLLLLDWKVKREDVQDEGFAFQSIEKARLFQYSPKRGTRGMKRIQRSFRCFSSGTTIGHTYPPTTVPDGSTR